MHVGYLFIGLFICTEEPSQLLGREESRVLFQLEPVIDRGWST